jgi:hypothetical protein
MCYVSAILCHTVCWTLCKVIEWLLINANFSAISWDDDEVRFVLDQHAELDFYSASLTQAGLESTIYRTRGEHAKHYTTDAVLVVLKSRGSTISVQINHVFVLSG